MVYSDSIKIVDYLDGFQYAGNILQFFPHAEGYVKVTPTYSRPGDMGYAYNYVYNYTDHLGNIRVSYSKDPQTNQLKILEENHYYPFGLKHSVYSAGRLRDFEVDSSNPEAEHVFLNNVTKTEYQYKFGAKEWQDELGLNIYDFEARMYDSAIGRTTTQDPLADTFAHQSPYSFFNNDPVRFVDPTGMAAQDWVKKGRQWEWNEEIKSEEQALAAGYDDYSDGKTNNTYTSESGSLVVLGENASWLSFDGDTFTSFSMEDGLESILPDNHESLIPDFGFFGDLFGINASIQQQWAALDVYESEGMNSYTNTQIGIAHNEIAKEGIDGGKPTTSPNFKLRQTNRNSSKGVSKFATAAKSKNSWNAFLQENKGVYSGKGWQKQAAKDYYNRKIVSIKLD